MKSISSQITNKQKQRSNGVALGFADSFMCTVWPLFLLTGSLDIDPERRWIPLYVVRITCKGFKMRMSKKSISRPMG